MYWGCLMGEAKIGLEYPGDQERGVWAKLNRLEYVPPVLRQWHGRDGDKGEEAEAEGSEVRVLAVLRDGSRLVVRERVGMEAKTNTTVVESQ